MKRRFFSILKTNFIAVQHYVRTCKIHVISKWKKMVVEKVKKNNSKLLLLSFTRLSRNFRENNIRDEAVKVNLNSN